MGYIIEAFRLLQESEKYGGHPCTRHIGLSNNKLMQRLHNGEGAGNGGIQYISTFTNVRDAAKAASQTFKDLPGSIDIALQKGGNNPPIRTDEAFKVRFALGGGVREYYVNHMKIGSIPPAGSKRNNVLCKDILSAPSERTSPKAKARKRLALFVHDPGDEGGTDVEKRARVSVFGMVTGLQAFFDSEQTLAQPVQAGDQRESGLGEICPRRASADGPYLISGNPGWESENMCHMRASDAPASTAIVGACVNPACAKIQKASIRIPQARSQNALTLRNPQWLENASK